MFKRRSTRLTGLVVIAIAAGVFLVWALPGVAGLSVFTESQVSSAAHNWSAINDDDELCTTLDSWTEVAQVNFHTTGFHDRVLIEFVGSWRRSSGEGPQANVRALIDDEIVEIGNSGTESVEVATPASRALTHGFTWISEELHPGSHSAEIEFNETATTAVVCVDERTTVVSRP
jgi:hypothetical protein